MTMMCPGNVSRTGAVGIGLCALGVLLLTAAGGAEAVECGAVVTGTEQLQEDLICTTDPALTLSGGSLNLRGHAVVCDGTVEGVVLEGEGARLSNGVVAGCEMAVLVEGDGRHVVAGVTVSVEDPDPDDDASAEGVRVSSNDNRVLNSQVLLGGTNAVRVNGDRNRVFGNTVGAAERGVRVDGAANVVARNVIGGVGEGIEVRGERNHISRNHIAGALDQGIELRGDGSRVVGNLAVDAEGDGISVFSSGNLVSANGVFSNGDDGIIVTATSSGNRIVNNRALGNATDLTDQNSGCDDNVWAGNVFDSADPDDCID